MVMPYIKKGQVHKPTQTNGHYQAHCAPRFSWGISLAGKTARQGKQLWPAQGVSMAMLSVPGWFNMSNFYVQCCSNFNDLCQMLMCSPRGAKALVALAGLNVQSKGVDCKWTEISRSQSLHPWLAVHRKMDGTRMVA